MRPAAQARLRERNGGSGRNPVPMKCGRAYGEEEILRGFDGMGWEGGKAGVGPAQGFFQVAAASLSISGFSRSKVLGSIFVNWIPCMYQLFPAFLSTR